MNIVPAVMARLGRIIILLKPGLTAPVVSAAELIAAAIEAAVVRGNSIGQAAEASDVMGAADIEEAVSAVGADVVDEDNL